LESVLGDPLFGFGDLAVEFGEMAEVLPFG
jgi:hypothetical protein